MKPRLLASLLTVSALALTSLLSESNATRAQNAGTNFVCGTWQGAPATLAQTAQGETVPVILWVSDYFSQSGFDPQTRCQLVSERFQQYYSEGTLNYLTTGRMNRMPVVCVAEVEGGSCSGLLFTLKPENNPSETLQRLLAVRVRAQGPLNETNSRIYIDMKQYLEEAIESRSAPDDSEPRSNFTPSDEGRSQQPGSDLW
jgi:hypothetical protein